MQYNAKIMEKFKLWEKAKNTVKKVPLSNDTIQHRITRIAEDKEYRPLSCLHQTLYFLLQLDVNTDPSSNVTSTR
jgi:hypothetical protein